MDGTLPSRKQVYLIIEAHWQHLRSLHGILINRHIHRLLIPQPRIIRKDIHILSSTMLELHPFPLASPMSRLMSSRTLCLFIDWIAIRRTGSDFIEMSSEAGKNDDVA